MHGMLGWKISSVHWIDFMRYLQGGALPGSDGPDGMCGLQRRIHQRRGSIELHVLRGGNVLVDQRNRMHRLR